MESSRCRHPRRGDAVRLGQLVSDVGRRAHGDRGWRVVRRDRCSGGRRLGVRLGRSRVGFQLGDKLDTPRRGVGARGVIVGRRAHGRGRWGGACSCAPMEWFVVESAGHRHLRPRGHLRSARRFTRRHRWRRTDHRLHRPRCGSFAHLCTRVHLGRVHLEPARVRHRTQPRPSECSNLCERTLRDHRSRWSGEGIRSRAVHREDGLRADGAGPLRRLSLRTDVRPSIPQYRPTRRGHRVGDPDRGPRGGPRRGNCCDRQFDRAQRRWSRLRDDVPVRSAPARLEPELQAGRDRAERGHHQAVRVGVPLRVHANDR